MYCHAMIQCTAGFSVKINPLMVRAQIWTHTLFIGQHIVYVHIIFLASVKFSLRFDGLAGQANQSDVTDV